jgi:hypothetical protein
MSRCAENEPRAHKIVRKARDWNWGANFSYINWDERAMLFKHIHDEQELKFLSRPKSSLCASPLGSSNNTERESERLIHDDMTPSLTTL